MFKDVAATFLYNPSIISLQHAELLRELAEDKLRIHEVIGPAFAMKIGTFKVEPGLEFPKDNTMFTATFSRKYACKGTTAQDIATHLGEFLDRFLDGGCAEVHFSVKVSLGGENGFWERT